MQVVAMAPFATAIDEAGLLEFFHKLPKFLRHYNDTNLILKCQTILDNAFNGCSI